MERVVSAGNEGRVVLVVPVPEEGGETLRVRCVQWGDKPCSAFIEAGVHAGRGYGRAIAEKRAGVRWDESAREVRRRVWSVAVGRCGSMDWWW